MNLKSNDVILDFPKKIDASTRELMHLKITAYIRCFIDMRLYNNFGDETKADMLWKKIESMFETMNVNS